MFSATGAAAGADKVCSTAGSGPACPAVDEAIYSTIEAGTARSAGEMHSPIGAGAANTAGANAE